MINNIDIKRIETGCDYDKERNKRINDKAQNLNRRNYEKKIKITTSKRFSKFLQKVLKKYAEGAEKLSVPLFASRLFCSLIVEKFDSYDLQNYLVYDDYNREVFFMRRQKPTRTYR